MGAYSTLKFTATVPIGTYYCPWFPYLLASLYNHVDEIIVANHGYLLDDLPRTGPLKRAHEDIKHLDVNGKIVELTDIDPMGLLHAYPLGTQRAANARRNKPGGEGNWFEMRGLNYTACNEFATQNGADYIIACASDSAVYSDAKNIRKNPGTWVFYQYEFAGDLGGAVNYLADPEPVSPYIDTMQMYKADLETWYVGGGAIMNHPEERMPLASVHCAHLRAANPAWLSRDEKFEHFYGRVLYRLFTHEYGYWCEEMKEKARLLAEQSLVSPDKKQTPVPPPEVCLFRDPLDYIRNPE